MQLILKDLRWEIFSIDTNKKKCKRFMKLQEFVLDYIKELFMGTPG